MLDLGWSELLVVAVVALIVVGPKELPALLRTIGKFVNTIRRQAGEFRSQFDDAIKDTEFEQVRKDFQELKSDAEATVRDAGRGIKDEMRELDDVSRSIDQELKSSIADDDELAAPKAVTDKPADSDILPEENGNPAWMDDYNQAVLDRESASNSNGASTQAEGVDPSAGVSGQQNDGTAKPVGSNPEVTEKAGAAT